MPCFPSSYDELLRVNNPLSQYYIHRQAVKHNTAYGIAKIESYIFAHFKKQQSLLSQKIRGFVVLVPPHSCSILQIHEIQIQIRFVLMHVLKIIDIMKQTDNLLLFQHGFFFGNAT